MSTAELAVSPGNPFSADFSFESSSSAVTLASAAASSSPSLFSRCLRRLRKPYLVGGGGCVSDSSPRQPSRIKKKGKGTEQEEEKCVCGKAAAPMRIDGMTGAKPPGSSHQMTYAVSGHVLEQASFNLGLGTGLILLISRSASEFNKMAELQRQMLTMLEDIKDAIQSKDARVGLSESDNTSAISASACCADLNTSKKSSLQRSTPDWERTNFALISNEHPNYVTDYAKNSYAKMDELEAELEFELELLQLNLEREETSVLSESYQEKMVVEEPDPFGSFSISSEEENVCNRQNRYKSFGVPARELEIKLHELLETRQRDPITELETALESTKRKLNQKGTS